MVAEIRESVEKGATVSGASGGLSAANADEQRAKNPSAASPAEADRAAARQQRQMRDVDIKFMRTGPVSGSNSALQVIGRRIQGKYRANMQVFGQHVASKRLCAPLGHGIAASHHHA
jgi:hypothetical protein